MRQRLDLEARFPGWQVLHADRPRWVRGVHVPAGCYAVHDRLAERPLTAETVELLAELIGLRERQRAAAARWVVGSDLSRFLPLRQP